MAGERQAHKPTISDADAELKRRRERGRNSQAAFRKRQTQAAQYMKSENKLLKETLQSIIATTSRSDRPELLHAIRKAAVAAGINAAHLDGSAEKTPAGSDSALEPETSAKGTSPSAQDDEVIELPQVGDRREVSTLESDRTLTDHRRKCAGTWSNPMRFTGNGDASTSLVENDQTSGLVLTKSTRKPSASISSIRPSHPLLSPPKDHPEINICPTWFNPLGCTRITDPPPDIIPYLGHGQYTLAGQLFWGVLEHCRTLCQHMHHPRSAADLRSAIYGKHNPSRPLKEIEPNLMCLMLYSRLQFRNLGYMSGEFLSVSDPDLGQLARKLVEDDFESQGLKTDSFLCPSAVELRVRIMMGDDVFGLVMGATKSVESSPEHRSIKSVIDKMADNFICFGDGPRWSTQTVNSVFGEWALRTMMEGIGD